VNIGEILVRFGAETSGFSGGIGLIIGLLGKFGDSLGLIGKSMGLMDMSRYLSSIGASNTAMEASSQASAAMSAGLKGVGVAAMAAAAALVIIGAIAAIAIGVISVKAASDFQQGMNRLVTGAGDVTDNMQKMGQSILGISTATGVLTGELLPAMYQIISSGERGAVAENTLKVAAMGAVAEQAKIVDVAKAITTAMTDYGTAQFNATQFMNGYTRATQLGKITLEELSTSMGPILPLAKNIGISFADVAGAMSTMTNAGIPAERAATSLRFLFQSLEVPTTKAKNAMESMGLSSVAVGNELKKSLPGALEMIYKAALKAGPEGSVPFNRAVSDMIGGQRSLQAYLALTGSHFATFSSNAKAVADAMNHSKTAVLGWDTAQSNFNVKLSQAHAALDAVFITIGSHLLPVLTQIVGQITPIIQKFGDWVTKSHDIENAIKAVTPYFNAMFDIIKAGLPVVVGLFMKFMVILSEVVKWVAQNKAVLDALMVVMKVLGVIIIAVVAAGLITLAITFTLIGIVIFGVIGVVMTLISIWKMMVAAAGWVSGAWHSVIDWLGGAWHSLVNIATSAFNAVKNAIVSAFNATIAWIVGAWQSAIGFIVGIWHTLSGAATTVFNAVKTAIMTAINAVITWLEQAWQHCVTTVVGWFNWLYNHNYYFKQLVDTIRSVVQAVITWLQTAWQNVVTFVVGLWNTLKGAATTAFNAVKDAITTAVNATVAWLTNAWNTSVAWIGTAWDKLKGLAQTAWDAVAGVFRSVWATISGILSSLWNSISGWFTGTVAPGMHTGATTAWQKVSDVFSSAWSTYISGPLASLWSSLSGWFSGLASDAFTWGSAIIQGVVDGINSMLGAIGQAANNVASTITGILGFHSPPKYGPASDADTWMPNMVNLLTRGMTAGVPSVTRAATQLAQPIQGSLSATGPGGGRASSTPSDTRPVVFIFGNTEVRGLVQNLGRELSNTVIIQKGGLR
jgi:TP901 family phage tail tape measure protein